MVVILVGLGLLAGCASGGTTTASPAAPAPPVAPLDTSLANAAGTWAVLAMGDLDQPNNTFWEAFYRPPNGGAWTLRTPRGVADNGGLVAAVDGTHVTFGFRPSNDLRFSPLATSSDLGRSYSPELLPTGLVDAPDALSVSASGRAAALTGTQIVTSGRTTSTWRPLSSTSSLQASSAGRRCGVQRVTAVVVTASGVAVGADCTRLGIAGVFTTSSLTFHAAGPALTPATTTPGATVDVTRLVAYRHGLAALLEMPTSGGTTYVAAWRAAMSEPWTIGPTLAAGTLLSASVTSEGGFSVVTRTASKQLNAAYVDPAAPSWVRLAHPPAHTATVSVTKSSTDALAVDNSTFTDYKLTRGRWIAVQSLRVRVPIGSSG